MSAVGDTPRQWQKDYSLGTVLIKTADEALFEVAI